MSSSQPWWRNAVVYQVYLRSFADGNGDGTGDIAGLRSRLPYICSLGVDALWINPWYVSPLKDGGYDVADYRRIDPRFGTIEEAIELIEEANRLGLRVLLDLVPNHTSSQHAWFREALTEGPGGPARSRYHFRPGRGPDGAEPPTDWTSVFGGPTWSRVPDGEWYLHLFDSSQPDLNWANPEVRAEFVEVLRFWLDRGASGFRVDVANGLEKDPIYPDIGEVDKTKRVPGGDLHPYSDRDQLHEIVREWRAVVDEYPEAILVAEAWVENWERLARYLRDDEYHQAFDFEFMESPWEAEAMRSAISMAVPTSATVGAVPTWVLSNHDIVRQVTRYGLPQTLDARDWLLVGDRALLDTERGLRRARAAALLMLGLPGSAYIFQGEELGLPEVHDLPPEVLDDPTWARSGQTMKGRDGCRVPLPWTTRGGSFGFGDDGSWLPQPADWAGLSVESQEGAPDSTLELYRNAIRLRSEHMRGTDSFEWVETDDDLLVFDRGRVRVMVNFGADPTPLPDGEIVVYSGDLEGSLPPDTAVWLLT
ncbi:MAG TPA: glycoside hydrolase family 13 protein [Acidimicrobiia bacterium]|nr:glycoside hydrolase family 13 protein [Acidimicrobiia bacterium]